ncbi:MAG: hypothetical protein ACI857_001891 [Arenicella sp.]|jgi:hypothetical protein
MRFNYKYGLVFGVILIVEVLIGLFVRDSFIRPFVGDLLVVVLIYTFLMMFFSWNPIKTAIGVFIFACGIEVTQYFQLNKVLGLESNSVADVALGSTFDPLDLLAYAFGTLLIILVEKRKSIA